MKKLLAMGMATMMMFAISPVKAADTTADVDTTDNEKTQEGTVWGTLSGTPLKQMKVTLPIKIDFAVVKSDTGSEETAPTTANTFTIGDYRIKVASDSDCGVELTKVNLATSPSGKWTLDSVANVALIEAGKTDSGIAKKQKTVSLNMGTTALALGDNTVTNITAVKGSEVSLGLSGTAGKAWIDESLAAASEKAFQITYTITQKD